MPTDFMTRVRAKTETALASGDLQPLQTEETVIQDQGLKFILRWASTLAVKDTAKPSTTILPGGPRDPDFNPFLNPDPALLLEDIGNHHVAILNKFPVCLYHLVIACKQFAEQQSPLDINDFTALAQILSGQGGLGFYNGGAAAGASQRHKHVQWLPPAADNASLAMWLPGLPVNDVAGLSTRHELLPVQHRFIRVQAGPGHDVQTSADSMLAAYNQALADLGLHTGADGLLPAFNMLVADGWMLIVPRSQEHFNGVSLNAPSFGGTIYVRNRDQIAEFASPLAALTSVALPA